MSVDFRTGQSLVDLGRLRVTRLDMAGALGLLQHAIVCRTRRYFCFCEGNLLAHTRRDPDLARVLQQADAVFADGIAVAMLAALKGRPLPGRVSGPSFMLAAVARGVGLGWRHFLYGGAPGVAPRLAEQLRQRHPSVQIVGTCSPPFRPLTEEEERELEQRIHDAQPDILWVALGSPKQELWVAQHVRRLAVPVLLPVGAAFDFHSGARPWAPRWVRRLGLEWAFRMLTGGPKTLARNLQCVPSVAAILINALASTLHEACRRRLGVGQARSTPCRRRNPSRTALYRG